VNKPSEIAYKQDMSEYLNLVKEMKESVMSNKIILKDSSKIIQYFDILNAELPNFKNAILKLDLEINKLKDKEKVAILDKLSQSQEQSKQEVERRMAENQRKNEILKNNSKIEEQINITKRNIEEQLQRLSAKKYKIIINIE
jgi:hypothetical protein